MNDLERSIMLAYFRLEEVQRERLRLERIWHPEKFRWEKRGAPPEIGWSALIRQEALASLGYGESRYQELVSLEANTKRELEGLAEEHPIHIHFQRIRGLSSYTCGAFIAASGDIDRTATVGQYWKGMGLDVLNEDVKVGNKTIFKAGEVPRRVRGSKGMDRPRPCPAYVSKVGEQIRQQITRSQGRLYEKYAEFRLEYDAKYPDRPKLFNFKAALRSTQKLLYSCLWREWKLSRGVTPPMPFAFEILKHDPGHFVTIDWFYEPVVVV